MQIGALNPLLPVPASQAVPVRSEALARGDEPSSQGREARAESPDRAEAEAGRGPLDLSEAEQALVRQLQQRDREVRAHELAHVAAGGPYVTAPATYQYQVGPDGRRYAVGGEVSIDTSVPSDPEAALAKAQIIQRAALAPADPSPQDYQVAAQARQMEAEARRELAAEQLEAIRSNDDPDLVETAVAQDESATDQRAPDRLALVTEDALAPTSRFSLFA